MAPMPEWLGRFPDRSEWRESSPAHSFLNLMAKQHTDGALVRRVQAGKQSAYRTLVERYERMVFSITNRYGTTAADAEDLAQEVFVKAFRQIDRLRQPDRFSSWLYGIALNHCRDYAKNIRRQTRPFSDTEQEAHRVTGATPAQDEQLEADEQSARLWDALAELSPTYATPFLLKYRDGLSYKAMSARMDVSVSALKVRVHRARKKLQALLDAEMNESLS